MNVIEVLQELDIPYREAGTHHHVGRNYVGIDCPYCSPLSGKFRMGIELKTLRTTCWSCGWHPTGESLAFAARMEINDVIKLLRNVDWERIKRKKQLAGTVKIPDGVGDLKKAHIEYLKRRGFDPDEIVETWGVQGIGVASELSWRLWIPVYSKHELISWTTRAVSDNVKLRYITARPNQEAASLKSVLYGDDLTSGPIVVVEGPTDAWRIGRGGVAILGLKYTHEQVMAIAAHPVRTVCFDQEPAAQAVARKLAEELSWCDGETHLAELETGKDPATADRGELDLLRRRFL